MDAAKKTILLVEDEALIALDVKAALEKRGYEVQLSRSLSVFGCGRGASEPRAENQ